MANKCYFCGASAFDSCPICSMRYCNSGCQQKYSTSHDIFCRSTLPQRLKQIADFITDPARIEETKRLNMPTLSRSFSCYGSYIVGPFHKNGPAYSNHCSCLICATELGYGRGDEKKLRYNGVTLYYGICDACKPDDICHATFTPNRPRYCTFLLCLKKRKIRISKDVKKLILVCLNPV